MTLYFDLSVDQHPIAGVLLDPTRLVRGTNHTVALPFASSDASSISEIYSRWGSYPRSDTTLVSFNVPQGVTDPDPVVFTPLFGTAVEEWADDPQLTELGASTESVFLIRRGQVRHFIYKFPDQDSQRQEWNQQMSRLADTQIDRIAVALPSRAKDSPIRLTARTMIPEPERHGLTSFFPGRGSMSQGAVPAIQVKYEIPPSKAQIVFVDEFVKLLSALLPPLATLMVIRLGRPDQRQRTKRLILALCLVQAVVLCLIVAFAVRSLEESAVKAAADLAIALASAIFSGIVLWKDKREGHG